MPKSAKAVRSDHPRIGNTLLLDNALNHPQFYVPDLGTDGFLDMTDYLINGFADGAFSGYQIASSSYYCFLLAAATHVSTSACDWPPRAL